MNNSWIFYFIAVAMLPVVIFNHGSPAWIGCYIPFVMMIIIINNENQETRRKIIKKICSKRRNKGERSVMVELAKRFIDKECIIYTFNSRYDGVTIKEVSDGALLIENKGTLEAVNLDFVVRIREYPKNKNGKKKSVVLD